MMVKVDFYASDVCDDAALLLTAGDLRSRRIQPESAWSILVLSVLYGQRASFLLARW